MICLYCNQHCNIKHTVVISCCTFSWYCAYVNTQCIVGPRDFLPSTLNSLCIYLCFLTIIWHRTLVSSSSVWQWALSPHEARFVASAFGPVPLWPLHLHQPRPLLQASPGQIPPSHHLKPQPAPVPLPTAPPGLCGHWQGHPSGGAWFSGADQSPSTSVTWTQARVAPTTEELQPRQHDRDQQSEHGGLWAAVVQREAPAAEATHTEAQTGEQESPGQEEQPPWGSALVTETLHGLQILYRESNQDWH